MSLRDEYQEFHNAENALRRFGFNRVEILRILNEFNSSDVIAAADWYTHVYRKLRGSYAHIDLILHVCGDGYCTLNREQMEEVFWAARVISPILSGATFFAIIEIAKKINDRQPIYDDLLCESEIALAA